MNRADICKQCKHFLANYEERNSKPVAVYSCQQRFHELMLLSYIDFKHLEVRKRHTIGTLDVLSQIHNDGVEFEFPDECPFKLEHLLLKQKTPN